MHREANRKTDNDDNSHACRLQKRETERKMVKKNSLIMAAVGFANSLPDSHLQSVFQGTCVFSSLKMQSESGRPSPGKRPKMVSSSPAAST